MRNKLQIRFIALFTLLASINPVAFALTGLCLFSSSAAHAQSTAPQIYRYEVHGKIVALPDSEETKKREIKIKHEAIKDYVDFSGAKVGMAAMTMSFPVADEVSLQGLSVGDNIQFVLESWWKPVPGDHITSIKKME